jgi:hypothetical protein
MLYIHRTACISPQQTFPRTDADLQQLHVSADNKLKAREPSYEGIPPGLLRRMGKTVRLGIGAALPLLREAGTPPDGILIGTANAGMEESIRFMQEIIDHEEGILSPGSFVQSTPNTIAAQISLLSRNKGYNITHVHGGLAFENALIDAAVLIREPTASPTYLIGGADEIGTYNYNIDRLQGWFKSEPLSSAQLYGSDSPGGLAGEGAAIFLVSDQKDNALARVEALATLHSEEAAVVEERLQKFLATHLPEGEKIDLLLSGENGDNRFLHFFNSCERILDQALAKTAHTAPAKTTNPDPAPNTAPAESANTLPAIARFKHMCGEYATAPAFALWIACELLGGRLLPAHMVKRPSASAATEYKRILIYNSYKGLQHSFMLVSTIS